MTLTTDPAWPWPALLAVALPAIALTLWAYLGQRASWRRFLTLLGLRLLALTLVFLAMIRPALALRDDLQTPSLLLIACDASESMTIQDEFDGQSRWERMRRLLTRVEPVLEQLRERHNVQIVFQRFDSDVRDFDPSDTTVRADGKRSDYGQMLQTLYERARTERAVRGLIVLGDGTDNGTRHPALPLAASYRSLPCPISTVAFGKSTTSDRQADIALTAIAVEPAPVVPVKGKMTVRTTVDAPGFENRMVRIRLLHDNQEVPILSGDREVPFLEEVLRLTNGNELTVICNAPAKAGEVKVTLRIEPLRDELATFNNEISTFVSVSKEGLSVLLVDKARFWEPVYIRNALKNDPRIRLFDVTFRNSRETPEANEDLYHFHERAYDVILLGDVTPGQVAAGGKNVLTVLQDLVAKKGTGLIFYGGFQAFSPAWKASPLGPLLPVELADGGQVDGRIKLGLTDRGRAHYLMRLVDDPAANQAVWERLTPLDGMNRLGTVRPGTNAEMLLQSVPGGDPVLVARDYGAGRVLAFAGDTTWRWVRPPDGQTHHARFWKQLVLWLARQEEAQGTAWVRPDTRRLGSGARLGFAVGLRGKGGLDLPEARFETKVTGPDGVETTVTTAREKDEERGAFWKTDLPGEYRLSLKASGKDADGQTISGEASARFLVVQDEAELARRAADPEFLKRLAAGGGGKALSADEQEFRRFLEDLGRQPLAQFRARQDLWPDWRGASLSGILPMVLLIFVGMVSLEWFLRRRWGMV